MFYVNSFTAYYRNCYLICTYGVDLKAIADVNTIDAKVNKNVAIKGAITVKNSAKKS